MSLLKLYSNGTRTDGKAMLCQTCHYGTVMRGAADSKEAIYCSDVGGYITMRVIECSGYKDKRLTTLGDMREMAWILSTNKAKTKIGFQKYSEWRKGNEGRELIPGEYD